MPIRIVHVDRMVIKSWYKAPEEKAAIPGAPRVPTVPKMNIGQKIKRAGMAFAGASKGIMTGGSARGKWGGGIEGAKEGWSKGTVGAEAQAASAKAAKPPKPSGFQQAINRRNN